MFLVLAASSGVGAQSPPADQRLENFIRLNQFASPYAGAQYPEQWCYYTKTDQAYNWWYALDAVSGDFRPVRTQNGFGIPFMLDAYGGVPTIGALVVSYALDGGAPTLQLEPVSSFTANAQDCAMGIRILTNGPYPVVGLAKDLAAQTVIDPAPEYRVWPMKGSYHRVRLIAIIPAAFQVGSAQVAGRIVLGFAADW